MTQGAFAVIILVLIVGAFLSIRICGFRFVVDRLGTVDTVSPVAAGTVSLIFGLFLAFGTAEITSRSRDLNLAVRKEVSVVRSIFKFAEGVGPSANSVRQSLIEYLQAVTTLEHGWLDHPVGAESPAQSTADTLVQVATLFVVQSTASASVKSLIIAKVDELRQARTERISLSLRTSGIPQWVVLTALALLAQFTIALGYVGKPNGRTSAVSCFTTAVIVAFFYQAWVDGLIGPSKIAAAMQSVSDVLSELAF